MKLTIRDPQDHWPAVTLEFDPHTESGLVVWNRRFADGTLAPSGEDLHPGWDLADHDPDINSYNHFHGVAVGYSNNDQDSRLSNTDSSRAVSGANRAGSTSDSVAIMAIAWLGGADDRDRLGQRGGSASGGLAPAGRGDGTNLKSQPTRLISG